MNARQVNGPSPTPDLPRSELFLPCQSCYSFSTVIWMVWWDPKAGPSLFFQSSPCLINTMETESSLDGSAVYSFSIQYHSISLTPWHVSHAETTMAIVTLYPWYHQHRNPSGPASIRQKKEHQSLRPSNPTLYCHLQIPVALFPRGRHGMGMGDGRSKKGLIVLYISPSEYSPPAPTYPNRGCPVELPHLLV